LPRVGELDVAFDTIAAPSTRTGRVRAIRMALISPARHKSKSLQRFKAASPGNGSYDQPRSVGIHCTIEPHRARPDRGASVRNKFAVVPRPRRRDAPHVVSANEQFVVASKKNKWYVTGPQLCSAPAA
jgi:hypothetical protein